MSETKKRKIEKMNGITWFQIEIDEIKLEIDYENSTVKKVKLEECFDIYSKMFYWRDHHRVSDSDVQVVKQFFQDKFHLKYLPNIRVRDSKELGYPVVFEILEKYFPYNKPILGICGGCQLLNVFFGGSLIQDIESFIEHEQPNPRDETSHEIVLSDESNLKIFKNSQKIFVNSAHHQGINKIGQNLIVDAYAPDNLIEAFHHNQHPLCMGVQWHPEFLITDFDKSIIKLFTDHAKNNF